MPTWVTLSEFKTEYKDIAGVADDDFIGRALDAAEAAIQGPGEGLDRIVYAAADTTEYFDVYGPEIDGRNLWVEIRGDLCSITTLTNGDGTEITSGQYTTYPKTLTSRHPTYDRIRLLGSASTVTWTDDGDDWENVISLEGRWSMFSAADDIPDNIKLACMMLAAFALEQRKTQVFDTVAIPDAGVITIPNGWPASVHQWLRGYRRL